MNRPINTASPSPLLASPPLAPHVLSPLTVYLFKCVQLFLWQPTLNILRHFILRRKYIRQGKSTEVQTCSAINLIHNAFWYELFFYVLEYQKKLQIFMKMFTSLYLYIFCKLIFESKLYERLKIWQIIFFHSELSPSCCIVLSGFYWIFFSFFLRPV